MISSRNPLCFRSDETLFQIDPDRIQAGDAVGIGIHTANALRGYEIGKMARERGAQVIFGGGRVVGGWQWCSTASIKEEID